MPSFKHFSKNIKKNHSKYSVTTNPQTYNKLL